jgi:hypothetical protein
LLLNTAPRNGPTPPTQHRRKAVETLAEALTNAMRRAASEKTRETIQQRDYLNRHTYVEALQQESGRGSHAVYDHSRRRRGREDAARGKRKPNAAAVCPQMAAGASWSSIGRLPVLKFDLKPTEA